ncbi:24137_t:CDS:2 [Cetraspora pellucida]|uniref:24137_t:CDS:1 n=1 Tax=Cetraspora pellucida TaxID=1433469 RepID=A0A9N9GAG1_9GLOM|nr:24137_t:CDS:2 [Cetraspora pellucida]
MPCYVDTIVKINQVRQSDKEESKLTVVWRIGTYPVESENCDMEMVLFVPINEFERDCNMQSVFEKNEYYSVGGKVVPGSYNGKLRLKMTVASSTHLTIKRDPGSNRCPLKVSLVGVAQDTAKEVNDENAIVRVLVKDYVGQSNSFIVNIVFPYTNSRFKHLMNSLRPNESVLFVIGQMEKKDSSSSQTTPGLYKSVRSRLLNAHQSVSENLSKESPVKNSTNDGELNQSTIGSSISKLHSSKRVRVEDEDSEHGNITSEGKKKVSNCAKAIKGEKRFSVVHNTRKRAGLFKSEDAE